MTDPKILFFAYIGSLACFACIVFLLAYLYYRIFHND